jgi:hypothetical protein
MKAVLAVALALVASAEAACPNACSGHGRCTNKKPMFSSTPANPFQIPAEANQQLGHSEFLVKKDSCVCFLRKEDGNSIYDYTNADCSGKVCPSGTAQNMLPYDTNAHTQLVECSSVGTCDRTTGVCACQSGFTGKACNRRKCPNDCSGRGKCRTLSEIVSWVAGQSASLDWLSSSLAYAAFDQDVSAGCLCDKGYRGPDCSIVECPSGADPMGGKGSESGRECSGRGICGSAVGLCTCNHGFHGTACENQLVELL